jgi:hypothetical protein
MNLFVCRTQGEDSDFGGLALLKRYSEDSPNKD